MEEKAPIHWSKLLWSMTEVMNDCGKLILLGVSHLNWHIICWKIFPCRRRAFHPQTQGSLNIYGKIRYHLRYYFFLANALEQSPNKDELIL